MATEAAVVATSPWRALVRAHAHAGTRAALRSGAVGVAVVIIAFGSAPDPGWTLMQFILGIVAPPAPDAWSDVPQRRLIFALLALAFGAVGARRVTAGATGWMASLPVSRRSARRAAWAASAMAALPAIVFVAGACVMTPLVYRTPLAPVAVLTLPLLLACAAAAALPVRPWPWRVVALLALLASVRHDLAGAAVAAALLLAWDHGVAGLAPPFRRQARGAAPSRAARHDGRHHAAVGLALRWTWRAAGPRAAIEALALAAIPVGFAALALRNNDDLAPATIAMIARLGAGLGAMAAVAAPAGALLARRPPWAWLRALPWSARQRVLVDVAALALPALAVAVAAAAILGPRTLAATLGVTLVAAPSAAGALRVGVRRQTGAVGEPAMAGIAAAALLAWWPWLALVTPALAVALVARAALRERGHEGAVRWSELRHDLAADAGWIGRT